MRLFTSIDFEPELKKDLESWVPELDGWKKTVMEQIHLTLVFIGKCNEEEKDAIDRRLRDIRFPAMALEISNLGVFPNVKKPRILWAGVSPDENLMELQKKISDRTESFQQRVSHREYVPHITLARSKKGRGKTDEVRALLQKHTYPQNAYIQQFNLKQSILKPTGSEHRILRSYDSDETH